MINKSRGNNQSFDVDSLCGRLSYAANLDNPAALNRYIG
jgi:hypothetical protein